MDLHGGAGSRLYDPDQSPCWLISGAREEVGHSLHLRDFLPKTWSGIVETVAEGQQMVVANETYDVFVSYSRLDWRHAAEIDSILRAKGLKPFFDRRNLAPGLPWVRALEQTIGAV